MIGKRRRTWLRRPKHSLSPFFFLLLSDLPSWVLLLVCLLYLFGFRAARRGMWKNGTDIELPSDYKKRYRVVDAGAKVEEEEGGEEPAAEEVGFWSRIFGRRKRAGDNPS